MPGGMLWESDYDRIRESVIRVADRFAGRVINFVEIGVNDGRTSRDLIGEIKKHSDLFVYYGVDPGKPPEVEPPYSHIGMISHLAISRDPKFIHRLPEVFFWVLVDGCHCAQCVIRDAILYGSRLAPGGEMLFHDASPRMQGRDPQNYESMKGYHDELRAELDGIQVRRVLDANLLGGFRLIQPAPDQEFGGVEAYEKI